MALTPVLYVSMAVVLFMERDSLTPSERVFGILALAAVVIIGNGLTAIADSIVAANKLIAERETRFMRWQAIMSSRCERREVKRP